MTASARHGLLEVVCAIIFQDNRLLVAQRSPDQQMPGKWEFPGGKPEPGESLPEAIAREILEELGCRVAPLEILPARRHRYPDFAINLTPIACRIEQGTPQPLEHAQIRWVTLAEADLLDWAAADRPILRTLRASSFVSCGPPSDACPNDI